MEIEFELAVWEDKLTQLERTERRFLGGMIATSIGSLATAEYIHEMAVDPSLYKFCALGVSAGIGLSGLKNWMRGLREISAIPND